MAYGYPGMYYPSPSVEQIAQQFQNAMGQYQNFQQGQMQQPKQKRCGEYIIVDGFDEVEKTPVRMDGTPTLFICPKEHIAWAKQYSRNGPTCETFPYSSSLTAVSHGPEQPEVDYTKLLDDTACSIRTRTRYSTVVHTSATSGVFRLCGQVSCAPDNSLTAIS